MTGEIQRQKTRLKQLGSFSRNVREAARQDLAQLPGDELNAMLQLALQSDICTNGFHRAFRVTFLLANALVAASVFHLLPTFDLGGFGFVWLYSFPVQVIVATTPRWRLNDREIALQSILDACIATGEGRYLGAALTRLLNIETAIDKVAPASDHPSHKLGFLMTVKQQTRLGLRTILPEVTSQDYRLLSPKQNARFYDFLRYPPEDQELQRLTLEAVMRLEDTRAIPLVRSLVEHRVSGKTQGTAEACLALLQACAKERENINTLLRASDASTDPSALLRPVSSEHTSANQEELLRPR